jgi:hypothetical protein
VDEPPAKQSSTSSMTTGPAPRRSAAKVARRVAVGLLGVVIALGVTAPRVVRDARFGWVVGKALPKMRGRLQIGGGRWSWADLYALARGRPARLSLADVRVIDPEGTEVLRASRISARVEVQRKPLRIAIDELRVEDAVWIFSQMRNETKIGFLAAFEPVGPRPPPARPAAGGFQLSIAGARLEGLTATFEFPSWGLVLRDVHADAALTAAGGRRGSVPLTYEVRGAQALGGGRLRLFGPRDGFELPFSQARLDRVATTDAAPDAIVIEASGVRTGRSTLHLTGTFSGIYGLTPASRSPGLALEAGFDEAADAIDALARSRHLGWRIPAGPGAHLGLRFEGPFARPHGTATVASPSLGRLSADATFDGRRAAGGLAFERFDLGALLPLPLAPFASGALDGTIRGHLDLRPFSGLDGPMALDELSLVLTRDKRAGAPRTIRAHLGPTTAAPAPRGVFALDLTGIRYVAGAIRLPRLSFKLRGGRFSAAGEVAIRDAENTRWLPSPVADLQVRAQGFSIESLLGQTFVRGGAEFRAHVHGPFEDLAVDLELPRRAAVSALGERFGLPSRVPLRIAEDAVLFQGLELTGPEDSLLDAGGRVGLDGKLAVRVVVRAFPIRRLPGLAQTGLPIAGRVEGELRLAGGPGLPAISGELRFAPVTFQGRPVGGGTVTISPGPHGAIRAHGRLIDGLDADGELEPKPAGLTGEARLELTKLRLDPFLAKLPGDISAAGVLSGRVVARIAPGRPAAAEGRLSELTLVVSPPPVRRRPAQPIELHAEGEIALSAESGEGPIRIGPARFRGDIGAFEVSGEGRGDDVRGTVRGRIEFAPFAALTALWFDRLAGAIDVNLTAARAGATGALEVNGDVLVAKPLALRLAATPFEARVPSGRIVLRGTRAETTGLPVNVRAAELASGMIRRLDADLRIDARAGGDPADPRVHAGVTIDRLAALVPVLGPKPIGCEQGKVTVEGQGNDIAVISVDLPVHGEVEGLSMGPGQIDRAGFALRLRGDPRRWLAVSGDVQIHAARVRAQALKQAGGARGGGKSEGGWLARPVVQSTALDVRLQSHGGAVVVDVPKLPDLRVDLDMHVGGTVKQPVVTGEPTGANVYSSLALALARLFR